jgi:methyltransferase family protein
VLEAEGLVRAHSGLVSAPHRITPSAGFHLLHDPWGQTPLPRDYVGGPNEAAETLAHLTVRRPVASALDLGTGCGIQALLAARHVDRVLATDLNPRACAFAELNARLNGVENVEVRSGNLFEPVEGERFDLILANPPYVISPASDLLFRDSGLAPGELCRTVLDGAARHLRVGGFACVLVNWATRGPAGRWDVPRSWTQGHGCDVCAFCFGPEPGLPYAARWSEPPASVDDAAHAEEVRRWLAFYEESGIDTIWFGGLVLRRREGANWFRGIDLGSAGSGSAADQIVRIFEATDFLEAANELDEARFGPAPGSRLTHVLEQAGEGFELGEATVALAEGLGVRGRVDPLAVQCSSSSMDGGVCARSSTPWRRSVAWSPHRSRRPR